MASVSNLPLAILEMDAQKARRFDMTSILTTYNREPLQRRALRTHDNRTSSLRFKAALMFVQNHEQFSGEPQKSRVCSILFAKNTTNIPALITLMKQPAGQLAGFRHHLLQQRELVLKTLLEQYAVQEKALFKSLQSSRVAQNYALLLAGMHACARAFGDETTAKNEVSTLFPYILKCAKETERTMQADSDLVSLFFDALQSLLNHSRAEHRLSNYAPVEHEKEVWISLSDALSSLSLQGGHWPKAELIEGLKISPSFLFYASKYIKNLGCSIRIWAFKREAILPAPVQEEVE